MGWMWACFGGNKHRTRRVEADRRVRMRSKDRSITQAPPPNANSLGAQLKSTANEARAYDELFQPRQMVSGLAHGSRLFKPKSVRRAKSLGSSTAFENGAKKVFDKNPEPRPTICVDRLQEEVEDLRRRLAAEEEEARRLRHEVSYLRSCGVVQSPDRYKNCSNFEKESLLQSDDKAPRNLQSWLGLTLSPTSRFRLEEQLRCMAADEMSKVPDKGLTNGQKALIVAARLWHYHGESQQDEPEPVISDISYISESDGPAVDISGESSVLSDGNHSDDASEETPHANYQLTSTIHVPSFRDDFQFGEDSSRRKATELRNPPDTCSEIEDFSFRLSAKDDKVDTRQSSAEKPFREITESQSVASCHDASVDYQKEYTNLRSLDSETSELKSPGGSFSAPPSDAGHVTSNSYRIHTKKFIDLQYRELEEKLLKSPKKDGVTLGLAVESSSPRQVKHMLLDNQEEQMSDASCSEVITFETEIAVSDYVSSLPSSSVTKPFFACKSGRLWQPLSPVREVESTSGEDLESASEVTKSSDRSIKSGSEWGQREDFPHDVNSMPDDDLFTLSPRRLHHSYNPWDGAHKVHEKVQGEDRVDSDLGKSVTGWTSSEEADFEDLVPIQCQSPAFSPRHRSLRSKFSKGKDLKLEEFPRDQYLKEMGIVVDDFLSSSDSSMSSEFSSEFSSTEKENHSVTSISPVLAVGQEAVLCSPNEASSTWKKPSVVNGGPLSQEFDHLVLASIENLPKWIGCHGILSSPVEKEVHCQVPHSLECNPEASQVVKYGVEQAGPTGREQNLFKTSEFSGRQDEGSLQIGESLDFQTVDSLGQSLHGFVYQDERALSHRLSSGKEKQHQQNSTGNKSEFSNPGEPGELHSFAPKGIEQVPRDLCLEQSNKDRSDSSIGQIGLILDSYSLDRKRAAEAESVQRQSEGFIVENGQTSGYGIKIPRLRDLFPIADPTELASETPQVNGGSEEGSATSRDGEETFHDCESPTVSGTRQPTHFDSPLVKSSPVADDVKLAKFSSPREEVHPAARRALDISPDDRPILGTVATHWGESNNKSKSRRREWDGQGIPNSTTKFKEDQRVNWHTTPFETRLEQALAKQTLPELGDQRRLFPSSVRSSLENLEMDGVKSAA